MALKSKTSKWKGVLDMDWFYELFINEAKAALETRGSSSGSGTTETLPNAEETAF